MRKFLCQKLFDYYSIIPFYIRTGGWTSFPFSCIISLECLKLSKGCKIIVLTSWTESCLDLFLGSKADITFVHSMYGEKLLKIPILRFSSIFHYFQGGK